MEVSKKVDLTEFCLLKVKACPLVADKAVKLLLVFSTPYICECD